MTRRPTEALLALALAVPATPAEAASTGTCDQHGLVCAYADTLTGYENGCENFDATYRFCYVRFQATAHCTAVAGGTCSATLGGDAGYDTATCTVPPAGSCATRALDAYYSVFFPRGTTRSACGFVEVTASSLVGGAVHTRGPFCFPVS